MSGGSGEVATVTVPAAVPPARASLVAAAVADVVPVLAAHGGPADDTGAFPGESLAALRRSGLMGLLVPTEHGGLGGDLDDLAVVAQALAGGCLSTTLAWVMHCQQVDAVARYGSAALRDRLLPRIASEGYYLASVTAEGTTGGQLLRGDAALVAEGPGYRFTRSAPVVTGGAHADGFLIKMRSAPDAPPHDVTLVYVDRAQATVSAGAGWDALGMRAVENVSMEFSGRVPADQVVGALGGFRRVVIEAFGPAAHIGWAACWLGAARAGYSALVRAVRSGRERVRVDPGSDLAMHRIARIRQRLEVVSAYLRMVLDEIADRRARGLSLEPPAVQLHLNTLKVLAATETFRAADEMVGLAGLRLGYQRNVTVPLERLFRDLRAASLTYDDNLLLVSNGSLCLLDPAVTTIGEAVARRPARASDSSG